MLCGVIEKLNLEQTRDFRPHFNPIGWVLGLISPAGPKDPVKEPRSRILHTAAPALLTSSSTT